MNRLSQKIGEVKTYYNVNSDMGYTKLYREDVSDSEFSICVSKVDGFPPALETGEENALIVAFYVMVEGKMKFHHAVYKSTLPSGKQNQGKITSEERIEHYRFLLGLDLVDTITITDDINNYHLLTAN